MSQGRRLIAHLKRKPHTYLEMLRYGISVCPWKRVKESLQAGEQLVTGRRGDLKTWRVVKATKWTA